MKRQTPHMEVSGQLQMDLLFKLDSDGEREGALNLNLLCLTLTLQSSSVFDLAESTSSQKQSTVLCEYPDVEFVSSTDYI